MGHFHSLLIEHLVPEGDNLWDKFLMLLTIMDYVFAPITSDDKFLVLLTIMDYVFAPITSDDKANYVAMLVEDFLTDFKELYPE